LNSMYWLMAIVQRDNTETLLDFLHKNGAYFVSGTLCHGTARKKTLDMLGIEDTEKVMLQTAVSGENVSLLMKKLVYEMGIDLPGAGIALSVPVGSVGGKTSFNYLAGDQKIETGGGKNMDTMKYSLITVIAENGSTEIVMDAAREAGAAGGTVVHAKGTGAKFTEKFLGVSIASEKEMIYIVTKKQNKDTIMKAIMDNAGADTDAKAVVFSLPVDNVVGLRSLTDDIPE